MKFSLFVPALQAGGNTPLPHTVPYDKLSDVSHMYIGIEGLYGIILG
jgi:hypothetical protein